MDISHLLKDTVTVAPRTGIDDNGDPSFGSTTEIDARFEFERELSSSVGDERDKADVFMTDEKLEDSYIVWLPGANAADPSEARRIDRIEKATPLSGGNQVKLVVLQ